LGWLLVTDVEARHLAAGHVPAKVRQMAAQLCETLKQMLKRKTQDKRTDSRRRRQGAAR
jgi:uncharacterized spore protein YtfJ